MRAVSLARGVVGVRAGAGGGSGPGTGAPDVVPIGRGKGVLAAGGRGGGIIAPGGGTAARGAGIPPAGGADDRFCDPGGLGNGTFPGFGTSAADVGEDSEAGGRDGRFIRTVLSSSGAAASPRRGGRLIRTVSFFGSLASAMVALTGGKMSLSEISPFVTRQSTLRQ
jgi:hypothetical protein